MSSYRLVDCRNNKIYSYSSLIEATMKATQLINRKGIINWVIEKNKAEGYIGYKLFEITWKN